MSVSTCSQPCSDQWWQLGLRLGWGLGQDQDQGQVGVRPAVRVTRDSQTVQGMWGHLLQSQSSGHGPTCKARLSARGDIASATAKRTASVASPRTCMLQKQVNECTKLCDDGFVDEFVRQLLQQCLLQRNWHFMYTCMEAHAYVAKAWL